MQAKRTQINSQSMTPEELMGRFECIECSDWDEFTSEVRASKLRTERPSHDSPIYRGHGDAKWLLSTVYDRVLAQLEDGGRGSQSEPMVGPLDTHIMKAYIRLFKDFGLGVPELKDTDDVLELAIQGRHHSLVTPLLDWTLSPYIAAYFAFSEAVARENPHYTQHQIFSRMPSDDVAIWALTEPAKIEKKHGHELKFLRERRDTFHRQKAQRGVFTYLVNPDFRDLGSFLCERSLEHHLHCYRIPGLQCIKALTDIEMMNISASTLFPDLEGAAIRANGQAYSLAFQRALTPGDFE